jgi:plasmid maintenance system antidote protein VapI
MARTKTDFDKEAGRRLLDELIRTGLARNDAGISKLLTFSAPQISRLRHGKTPVTAELILRVHDRSGWSIERIRSAMQ